MFSKIIKFIFDLLDKHAGLRYFIAGGTAGVTDLILLYAFHHVFGIHYLLSAIIAFIIAFFMSFTFHKFWTFRSHDEKTHKQMIMYLFSSLFGLFLNTLLMYVFVDFFGVGVILSQIIVGLLVAVCSFFISRNIVFKFDKLKYEASRINTENK